MDQYESGEFHWWHLSEPSPELLAATSDGWLTTRGWTLDVGCGQGIEAEALAAREANVVGIDRFQPYGRPVEHTQAQATWPPMCFAFPSMTTPSERPSTEAASTTSLPNVAPTTPAKLGVCSVPEARSSFAHA